MACQIIGAWYGLKVDSTWPWNAVNMSCLSITNKQTKQANLVCRLANCATLWKPTLIPASPSPCFFGHLKHDQVGLQSHLRSLQFHPHYIRVVFGRNLNTTRCKHVNIITLDQDTPCNFQGMPSTSWMSTLDKNGKVKLGQKFVWQIFILWRFT